MGNTLYLIRHGDTEGTLKDMFYGSTDLPLAEEGVQQIKSLCDQGAYPEPEGAKLYTSGMLRTEQTFELIFGNREHEIIHDLREVGVGIFEMKTMNEVLQHDEARAWLEGKKEFMDFPEGETNDGLIERVARGLDVLKGDVQHSDVVGVLHGAVIFTCMEMLFPAVKEKAWHWTPSPASGYAITFDGLKPVKYRKIG